MAMRFEIPFFKKKPPAPEQLKIEISQAKGRLNTLKPRQDDLVREEVKRLVQEFLSHPLVRPGVEEKVAKGGFNPDLLSEPRWPEELEDFLVETYRQSALGSLKERGIDLVIEAQRLENEIREKEKLLGATPIEEQQKERQKEQEKSRDSLAKIRAVLVKDFLTSNKDELEEDISQEGYPNGEGFSFLRGLFLRSQQEVTNGRKKKLKEIGQSIDQSIGAEVELIKNAELAEKKAQINKAGEDFLKARINLLNTHHLEWRDVQDKFSKKLAEIQKKINASADPGNPDYDRKFSSQKLKAIARMEKAMVVSDILAKRAHKDPRADLEASKDFDPNDKISQLDFLKNVWARKKAWDEVKKENGEYSLVDLAQRAEEDSIYIINSFDAAKNIIEIEKRIGEEVRNELDEGKKEEIRERKNIKADEKDKLKAAYNEWKGNRVKEKLEADKQYQKYQLLDGYVKKGFPQVDKLKASLEGMSKPESDFLIKLRADEWSWQALLKDPELAATLGQVKDQEDQYLFAKKKFQALRELDPDLAKLIEREHQSQLYQKARSKDSEVVDLESEQDDFVTGYAKELQTAQGADAQKLRFQYEDYKKTLNMNKVAPDTAAKIESAWYLKQAETFLEEKPHPKYLALESKIERKKGQAVDFYSECGPYLPDIKDRWQRGDAKIFDHDRLPLIIKGVADIERLSDQVELGMDWCRQEIEAITNYQLYGILAREIDNIMDEKLAGLSTQEKERRKEQWKNQAAGQGLKWDTLKGKFELFKNQILPRLEIRPDHQYWKLEKLKEFYQDYIDYRERLIKQVEGRVSQMPPSAIQGYLKEIVASSSIDTGVFLRESVINTINRVETGALETGDSNWLSQLTELDLKLKNAADNLDKQMKRDNKVLEFKNLQTGGPLQYAHIISENPVTRLIKQYLGLDEAYYQREESFYQREALVLKKSYEQDERAENFRPGGASWNEVLATRRKDLASKLKTAIENLPK